MNVSAYINEDVVTVVEFNCDVRYTIDHGFASLNVDDLNKLWEEMPHGACPSERDEIENYLASIAEGSPD